jgi:hypothetical protein
LCSRHVRRQHTRHDCRVCASQFIA